MPQKKTPENWEQIRHDHEINGFEAKLDLCPLRKERLKKKD